MDIQAGQRAQAFNTIRERVASGEYPVFRRIPSQATLALQLGVSRHIIRIAVARLSKLGYLVTTPGQGTHVRPRESWPTEGEGAE